MSVKFIDFVSKYTIKKGKLVNQASNIVPRVFPNYSSNPKGANYGMFCKYQLLKYKPWEKSQHDAWGSENSENSTFINAWHEFLTLPYAQQHAPNWTEKMQNVLDNIELSIDELTEHEHLTQEEWMMLSQFHTSVTNSNAENRNSTNYNWQLDSTKYSEQDRGEMPNWIKMKKGDSSSVTRNSQKIDTNSFSEKQKLAYDIIINHSNLPAESRSPLLVIIIGEAGTGKSYLINAISCYLKKKCLMTATTGKAAFNINGVTIHSLLKLPVTGLQQKDFSGQSLVNLQENLLGVDYLLIDEYSMLGQSTLGWMDRRCRQATGLKDQLFGGKSMILLGDAGQLPPVCDKPLYHSKPCNELREQGYMAYQMFDKVLILDVNQRVKGSESNQIVFRELLSRLRNGESSHNDWELLLTRQSSRVENLNDFHTATRLYYSNEQVTKYNYDRMIQLNIPVAKIHAIHSSEKAKHTSFQDMLGLQPELFICKGASVMLTMNLWPSVGLCNGSTGTVIDIIYSVNNQPPDLPIAVVVKFDYYSGSVFSNMPSCVPIPPVTATATIGNSIHERQQTPLKLA